MAEIPREWAPDSTLGVLTHGYDFISKRCRRHGTDAFRTRLLLRKAVCMRGEDAARIFYDNDRFQRQGAAPALVRKTLFGEGGVQVLDGETHRQRKRMFMSLMTPTGIERLVELVANRWSDAIERWQEMPEVELFRETSEILCAAVCTWVGVPLEEADVARRTDEQLAMIDGPGSVGPRHWRGRRARARSERWIGGLVEQIRAGTLEGVPAGSALRTVAMHRDPDGRLLEPKVAAVEVLNLIRPTVAVARWITFAALALHDHPEFGDALRNGEDKDVELFVQEVRRFYPFFPFAAALARRDFEWRGYRFRKGTLALLDLYGTDHHPETWADPDEFRPRRFREWDESAYNFIPQGGGDFHEHHRCPGEWISIELVRLGVRMLTEVIEYDVPDQDLSISKTRMPTLPASGFRMREVRPAGHRRREEQDAEEAVDGDREDGALLYSGGRLTREF